MSSIRVISASLDSGSIKFNTVKTFNQSNLTSECWMIQFNGLEACGKCEFVDTEECGGQNIRNRLLMNNEPVEDLPGQ